MKRIEDFNDIDYTILERFARSDNLEHGLLWMAKGVTPVKTATAFQLARGGRDVWAIDADGIDHFIEDVEMHSEHYPDKSLSYPDVETIFMVEGEL